MEVTNLFHKIEKPSNWNCSTHHAFSIEEINTYMKEYSIVRDYLNGIPLRNLQRIVRVENSYLYGRYLIRKQEYETKFYYERILLHATGANKVSSIITNNLDWRMARRVKFGQGVSFSNSASYANKECSRGNGTERAIIIAKVLVGNTELGYNYTKLPSTGYDTTVDSRGNVFVKYFDDEFYPEYVAYYRI